MKRQFLAVATVTGLVIALPAAAQFKKPEDAIKYRQSVMTVMANHFGRVGAMVSGRAPFDAAAAAMNGEVVLMMSKLPFVAYVEGTSSSNSPDTKAKPEIWTERAKFDSAAHKMQENAVKFAAAAKSGNMDQIKAAAGDLGGACKSCHDDFRAK